MRPEDNERIRAFTQRKVKATLLCSLSPIPLVVPFGLLSLFIMALVDVEDKICEGTMTSISEDVPNLCNVPSNVKTVKVVSDSYSHAYINNYLFNEKPPFSDKVSRETISRSSVYISSYFKNGEKEFGLLEGSKINLSFEIEDGTSLDWYWSTKGATASKAKKTALITHHGNTFNLSYTVQKSGTYYMFIDASKLRLSTYLYARGSYDINHTLLKLDNPAAICSNQTVCIFNQTAGKYIVGTYNKSFGSTNNKIIIGKDFEKSMPTVISVGIVIVVCLIIGVAMLVSSCIMFSRLNEDYPNGIDGIIAQAKVDSKDRDIPSLSAQAGQTPSDVDAEIPPAYPPTEPEVSGAIIPDTSSYPVSPY